MITISESKYKELKEAADLLDCLEAFGVDNWEGYEDAQAEFRNMKAETNEIKKLDKEVA